MLKYAKLGVVCASIMGLTACQSTMPNEPQQAKFISKYRTAANDQKVYLPNSQATVHYTQQGDASKPLMVLIHGVNASYDTWNGWLAAGLLNSHQVLAIDMPPFGLSSYNHPDKATITDTAKLLAELLTTLNITQKVTVVGNSYGGYVAWSFAAQYADKVDKLVLIDASGYQTKPPFIISLGQNPLLAVGYKVASPCFVVNYFYKQTYANPRNQKDQAVNQRYCELNQQGALRVAASQFYQNNPWQLTSFNSPVRPTAVTVPTLIMWGNKDTIIDPAHALLFKREITNAQLVYYDNLGHVPMEEDPQTTLSDVLKFMAQP